MNKSSMTWHNRKLFFSILIIMAVISVISIIAINSNYIFKSQFLVEYIIYTIVASALLLTTYLGYRKLAIEKAKYRSFKKENESVLKNVEEFISRINNEDFESDFSFEKNESDLTKIMYEFREKQINYKKTEIERQENEKKERWMTEGIAKFESLIRDHGDNLNNLSYEFISNLVKYVDANQAGFFVEDNNDEPEKKVYKLLTCFAWGRKKFVDNEIHEGEGLTGACIYEKQSIYITDIPDNYAKITSGLGEANPKCIFIAPIIHNDTVLGAIEIASLKELPEYKRQFIEKIMVSIASEIESLKISQTTAELLDQSKTYTEQLQSQEEELKQNLEEMQSTQEELERKQHSIKQIAEEIIVEEQKLRGFITELKESDI